MVIRRAGGRKGRRIRGTTFSPMRVIERSSMSSGTAPSLKISANPLIKPATSARWRRPPRFDPATAEMDRINGFISHRETVAPADFSQREHRRLHAVEAALSVSRTSVTTPSHGTTGLPAWCPGEGRFPVRVVYVASGCVMIAKVRRRKMSSARLHQSASVSPGWGRPRASFYSPR